MKNTGIFNSPYSVINLEDKTIAKTNMLNGQGYTLLSIVDPNSYDYEDVGVLYNIQLEDGKKLIAFPEEIGR